MKKEDLPNKIPVFPLSNFIIFPKTTVPLNIFEPRYIDMINDSMKSNKLIGMIQPKTSNIKQIKPELHEVGCLGKITSFRETEDGRFLIEVKGLIRFRKITEMSTAKTITHAGQDEKVPVLPVSNYAATLSVKEKGGSSEVKWVATYYRGYLNNNPPNELNEDAADQAVTAVLKAGLTSLLGKFQSGAKDSAIKFKIKR